MTGLKKKADSDRMIKDGNKNQILQDSYMAEELRKNRFTIGVMLMLSSAVCTSIGQLFWKLSESRLGWFLFLGFLLYGLGAVLMIAAFQFGELSKLHPILCTSYIIALFLGFFVLEEPVTWMKIIAILFILAGVVFITGAISHD